jgi:hypothetical protein
MFGFLHAFLAAKDDLGLRRMQLQIALLKPVADYRQHVLCLSPATTVENGIVSVPLELDVWILPSQPVVESVVQKEVG